MILLEKKKKEKKADQAPNYFNTNLNPTTKLDEYPRLLQIATVAR